MARGVSLPRRSESTQLQSVERHLPVRLVLRRAAQGMYAVAGMGLVATITAAFASQLAMMAIVAGVSTSLLVAALGLIAELLGASLRRYSGE